MNPTADDTPDLEATAARLDRLRDVPEEVLTDLVMAEGLWVWLLPPDDGPDWDHAPPSDQALAAALCAGCPVIDVCLELVLRVEGETTTGVWGGLCQDDRRVLHAVWHRRRTDRDQQGGPTR